MLALLLACRSSDPVAGSPAAVPPSTPEPAPTTPPAPTSAESFSFLVYGDSRGGDGCDGNATHRRLVERMAAEPASFAVHLGDLITGYDASTNWVDDGSCTTADAPGSLRTLLAPLQAKTPAPGLSTFVFPVIGNHDDGWGDGWYPDPFGRGVCEVFDLPALVPNHTREPWFHVGYGFEPIPDAAFAAGLCSTTSGEVYPTYAYYSFDFADSHFVVMRLDNEYVPLEICNSCGPDTTVYDDYWMIHQLDWLRADLDAAAARPELAHVFVFLHAPLITTSDGHQASPSFGTLAREFTEHGVDIVFSGHNHVYERSWPIAADGTALGVRDDLRGTVYTVAGGGGAALHGFNTDDDRIAVRFADYHYLRVDVSGPAVSVSVTGVDGASLDDYSL